MPHQNEINTSADRRKTFSSSWWSCSGKLIDSWLYPVIFLSLRTLLLMIHIKFFHKQKHWKIHVVLDCMEDPLFARGQNRKSKKADCECEYVSAPQVLFAELQVDAWMTWQSFSWLHCWWHLESLIYQPVFNVKMEMKNKKQVMRCLLKSLNLWIPCVFKISFCFWYKQMCHLIHIIEWRSRHFHCYYD